MKVDLEGEEWKDIEGYEGKYLISNMGRVYNTKKERLLKINPDPKKKSRPAVYIGGRCYALSALVGTHFVSPFKGKLLMFIDSNIYNCRASNLIWGFGVRSKREVKPLSSFDVSWNLLETFPNLTKAAETLVEKGLSSLLIQQTVTRLKDAIENSSYCFGAYWKYEEES